MQIILKHVFTNILEWYDFYLMLYLLILVSGVVILCLLVTLCILLYLRRKTSNLKYLTEVRKEQHHRQEPLWTRSQRNLVPLILMLNTYSQVTSNFQG